MSTIVLARKWRPKNFSELVGQQHVMQALANALDQQRLHHAYLFTGTRGVGKTTIARIFSKALNCEQGITSTPCGVCPTCRSIDEGRFVDLIEVDAASKTKVEDTRELLENVQYAPVQGRFKVYLIDEVHMLSKSSFNALLKTLEEPPEHVKFLLATTDPHKLPITVLSRCLQFNLMRLTPVQIQTHLAYILQQENIPFEEAALAMIAKSADGSARDSLSILDQAIAYGGGQVMFEPVQAMLGLVDQQFVSKILTALLHQSAEEIKVTMQELSLMGVDYEALNNQLIEVFHQLAWVQILGGLNEVAVIDESFLKEVASSLSPEKVQVLYQIALLAKQDMMLAPDIRIGFEMALLRMLAFEPQQNAGGTSSHSSGSTLAGATPSVAPSSAGQFSAQIAQESARQGEVAAQIASPSILLPEENVHPESIQFDELVKSPLQSQPARVESGASHYDTQSSSPNLESSETTTESASDSAHLMSLKERISQTLGKLHRADESAQSLASNAQSIVSTVEIESESHPLAIEREDVTIQSPTTAARPAVVPFEPVHSNVEEAPMDRFALAEAAFDDYQPAYSEEDFGMPANEFSSHLMSSNLKSTEVTSEKGANSVTSTDSTSHLELQQILPDRASTETPIALWNEENPEALEMSEIPTGNGVTVFDWIQLIQFMRLEGWAAELAQKSQLIERNEQALVLSVDPAESMAKSEIAVSKLEEVILQKLDCGLRFIEAAGEHQTPAKYWSNQKLTQQQDAVEYIYQDPQVQGLVEVLNMRVIESSIQPISLSSGADRVLN